MRKVNFIIIAIFTLILAGNAFGQWHPEIDRVKGKVKTTKIKAKKPGSFQEVSGIGMERRKHPNRNSVWGMETNYRKKPQNISNPIGTGGNIAVRRKNSTRKRKN